MCLCMFIYLNTYTHTARTSTRAGFSRPTAARPMFSYGIKLKKLLINDRGRGVGRFFFPCPLAFSPRICPGYFSDWFSYRLHSLSIPSAHLHFRNLINCLLFQLALMDGLLLADKCPLTRSPLYFLPADVNPLNSLCLCTGLQIQFIFGLFRTALCIGSTRMTS